MIRILLLAFLFSFCSLGYQIALTLSLSDASGDFVLSQAAALGTFLLGMGVGAWRCERRSRDPWPSLLKIEWALSFLGFFSVAFVQFAETGLHLLTWGGSFAIFALALPYVFALGFLTGFELPLLLAIPSHWKPGHLLAANYLGAFGATVLIPMQILPLFDTAATAHVLGLINFLTASLLLGPVAVTSARIAFHFGVGLAILTLARLAPNLSELHLKTVYFQPKIANEAGFGGAWNILRSLESPIRLRSSYQWIDLLPPEFSANVQGDQDFQIYMDRKLQLSSGSVRRYHESMVHGGINLLGRVPERVLILGGGDGLLARELLTYEGVGQVEIVELDSAVIRLARSQKDLRDLNGNSLNDRRVQVHERDALQFVRDTSKTYELILIDLPFPNSYDLSLLYTKEFYALVRKRMNSDGVMLLDFPLPGQGLDALATLVHTLKAGGFSKKFAFGTDDFFMAAANRSLAFDFDTLLPKVSNQTLLNLLNRAEDLALAEARPARVNSLLFPIRFGALQ